MRRTDIVSAIGKRLREIYPEAECILYGSEARGEARIDSDIDLLILLPDFQNTQLYISKRSEISGMLFELSLTFSVEISPMILPRNVWQTRKTPFTINVTNDGIRI